MKMKSAVIKLNYNVVAAIVAIALVAVFCIAEFAFPSSVSVTLNKKDVAVEKIDLPVLMYHHITTSKSRVGDYVLLQEQFEDDLKYIKECGYQTISTKELLDYVEKGAELPQKPLMITFDDGYESFHEYAFPLLKKYNMKAVFAVIGKHSDTFSNPDEPRHINYSHASWEQLLQMQQSGLVEIANHSYDMHNPRGSNRYGVRKNSGESDAEYEKAMYDDVGRLSEKIKQEVGVFPTTFAYPFGAICKESKTILAQMGFRIILTCEEKVNHIKRNQAEPIVLKRYNRAAKYKTYDIIQRLSKDAAI